MHENQIYWYNAQLDQANNVSKVDSGILDAHHSITAFVHFVILLTGCEAMYPASQGGTELAIDKTDYLQTVPHTMISPPESYKSLCCLEAW